jgi:hypothetical protein
VGVGPMRYREAPSVARVLSVRDQRVGVGPHANEGK